MPQTLSFVLLHVIFSTRGGLPVLGEELRPELFAYLATVARGVQCECYRVGGVADHVHLAVRLPRTVTVAQVVEEIKTASSKWLKMRSPALPRFAWQRGYGAFSVGPTDLQALVHYIEGQERHHRRRSFEDEFRVFLKRYGMDFDERYVWD